MAAIDRLRADQPILRRDLLAVVGDEAEQRAQVVEVEQQEPAVVGKLEGDLEHALLRVVDLEHAAQEARAYLADRRADRMTGLAVQIPEHDGARFVGVALDADLGDTLLDPVVARARHRQARDVALHVGHEYRNAQTREAFRHHHQRDRLARAGGAGDQAVPISVSGEQMDGPFTLADEYVVHAGPPSEPGRLRSPYLTQRRVGHASLV